MTTRQGRESASSVPGFAPVSGRLMHTLHSPRITPPAPWARPFLRWLGSKRASAPFIASRAPRSYKRYIEPFMGSAAVFFAIRPPHAVLSDQLAPLVRTFDIVRAHPRRVGRRLARLGVAGDDYATIRSRWNADLEDVDFASHFIYLNAHCFNGLYRTNRRAEFNVPQGSRAGRLPTERELYRASVALRAANLTAADAWDVLQDARDGDFVYLDPPYPLDRPTFGEYGYHAFTSVEWFRLIEFLPELDSRGVAFLLSAPLSVWRAGQNAPYDVRPIEAIYRAGGTARARRTQEVLVSNSPDLDARIGRNC